MIPGSAGNMNGAPHGEVSRFGIYRTGKRTGNGEYSSLGGEAYARSRMADAQHAVVFPAD